MLFVSDFAKSGSDREAERKFSGPRISSRFYGSGNYLHNAGCSVFLRPFFSVFFLLLLFTSGGIADAYEVAVLKSAHIKPYADALEGFESACACDTKELSLNGDEGVAAKIYRMRPDAVFAIGLDSYKRALDLKNIPVVFMMVPPSAFASSEQKGIYGVSMSVTPAKQLEAMLEIFPNAKRIGIIHDPRSSEFSVGEALKAAQSRRVELVVRKASRSGEVPALIEGMKDAIDAFWMIPDKTVVTPDTVSALLLFSFQNRVPVFTFSRKYVELGAVAGLSVDPFDLGVQAGEIARRLLAEKATPTPALAGARKTVLTINRKVANKLGTKIRDDVLKKAEAVN